MRDMTTGDHDLTSLPFAIKAFGLFPPSRVHVAYDSAPRPTTGPLEELIATEWTRQTTEARRHDRLLFNGDLLRYVSHSVEETAGAGGQSLHLMVGPTCYRDFVGTNLFNHTRLDEFDWSLFANPIGTTATLVTRDNLICYGRRSARVAYHAGHVHTFGGALEKRDQAPDGSIDPFGSLCRELDEELALQREELVDLCCVGLIRDREICQPELLFEAQVRLTADDIRNRWQSASERHEHDEIVTLRDGPEAIVPFIQHCGAIAPVAIGALFLHGRRRWGDPWFRQAAEDLSDAGRSSHGS